MLVWLGVCLFCALLFLVGFAGLGDRWLVFYFMVECLLRLFTRVYGLLCLVLLLLIMSVCLL